MPTPQNTKLYNDVKSEAKRKFKRWPSAYGSAWLVREYKRRGGKYKNESKVRSPATVQSRRVRSRKSPRKTGVSRWMDEEWIQVVPYLMKGERVACGAKKDMTKACRPFRRISDETPITLPELLKLHSKKDLLSFARKKNKDMDGRAYWKQLKFVSSS